jgi:hypothetical protein
VLGIEYLREEREVQLTGYSGRTTTAVAELITFDRQQRLRRAWLALVTWWALSAVSILVIIAHLVLVPGFFVLGIYSFVRRLKMAEVAVSIHGTCPDCDAEQDFNTPDRWDGRLALTCGNCRRTLRGLAVDG